MGSKGDAMECVMWKFEGTTEKYFVRVVFMLIRKEQEAKARVCVDIPSKRGKKK